MVAFWRRKPKQAAIDETAAYERSYGDRRGDVRVVHLPPRQPRDHDVLATGELLRRAFLDRLDKRDVQDRDT